MASPTGRRSAVVPLGWGLANVTLCIVLMAFGGDSLEGSAAGAAATIIELYALLLYLGRRREAGTVVVQPVARSGWPALFLALALVLLGMALVYGAWTAVVAPVPLAVAGVLGLAPRKGTRPTLGSATARAITDVAADTEGMSTEDRKAAFLAAQAAGVEGLSPLDAQAVLTRPAPPPSYAETAEEAATASGAAAAQTDEDRRARRRGRAARVARALSAAAAAGALWRRREKNRRSWE